MPEAGKRMAVHASWWNCANKGTTAVAIASPGSCTSRVSAAVRKAAIASAPRIAIMMNRSHPTAHAQQHLVAVRRKVEGADAIGQFLQLAGFEVVSRERASATNRPATAPSPAPRAFHDVQGSRAAGGQRSI